MATLLAVMASLWCVSGVLFCLFCTTLLSQTQLDAAATRIPVVDSLSGLSAIWPGRDQMCGLAVECSLVSV